MTLDMMEAFTNEGLHLPVAGDHALAAHVLRG
jgi:hypothetical protein